MRPTGAYCERSEPAFIHAPAMGGCLAYRFSYYRVLPFYFDSKKKARRSASLFLVPDFLLYVELNMNIRLANPASNLLRPGRGASPLHNITFILLDKLLSDHQVVCFRKVRVCVSTVMTHFEPSKLTTALPFFQYANSLLSQLNVQSAGAMPSKVNSPTSF